MKEISVITAGILADIKNALPALLTSHGADAVEIYAVGYATDQGKKSCGVYFSEMDESRNETFTFGINLQLNQVTEEDSYKYLDAVNDYLRNSFSPQSYGFADFQYKIIYWAPFKNSSPELFFDVTMSDTLEDCE
ncbi:MAG: hypothetical protein LBJ31_11920 [Treponema sp.]|jgi:hypothetical protein|nr:hypothetical protein [Treponema sp.]